MKSRSTGATFHDFEKTPFVAFRLIGQVLREQDAEGHEKDDNKKKGAVLGYEGLDLMTDEATIVGNSHAISKNLKDAKPGTVFGIKFLGKTENSKNQPVNRFQIDEAENDEDVAKLIEVAEKAVPKSE